MQQVYVFGDQQSSNTVYLGTPCFIFAYVRSIHQPLPAHHYTASYCAGIWILSYLYVNRFVIAQKLTELENKTIKRTKNYNIYRETSWGWAFFSFRNLTKDWGCLPFLKILRLSFICQHIEGSLQFTKIFMSSTICQNIEVVFHFSQCWGHLLFAKILR